MDSALNLTLALSVFGLAARTATPSLDCIKLSITSQFHTVTSSLAPQAKRFCFSLPLSFYRSTNCYSNSVPGDTIQKPVGTWRSQHTQHSNITMWGGGNHAVSHASVAGNMNKIILCIVVFGLWHYVVLQTVNHYFEECVSSARSSMSLVTTYKATHCHNSGNYNLHFHYCETSS